MSVQLSPVNTVTRLAGLGAAPRLGGSLWLMAMAVACLSGCTSLLSPINGIPANRLPPHLLGQPRNDWQPVNIARLRAQPSREYLLDDGDILGIYIESVLGTSDEPPPVHFPEAGSDLPPAIGFPIPVREDGTLSLPLIPPVSVRGMTVAEAESVIRTEYTVKRRILQPGRDRIIVTLMQERTIQVIVIRADGGKEAGLDVGTKKNSGDTSSSTQEATGHIVNLKAYKNDVLHALAATGGLPGSLAKNEVKILRTTAEDLAARDAFVQAFYAYHAQCGDPCICPPPLPDDPSIVKIPLRLPPGQIPTFTQDDVILREGDIVYVEARDNEYFFTGGLLQGGQFPLPRDQDLDVLGAMALAGQGAGSRVSQGGGGGGGGGMGGLIGSLGGANPTQLYVLRKTPCNGQVIITVNLNRAINDPSARILVQPGDTLILRYKPEEELLNFGLAAFFTFGIRELFKN